MIIAIDGPAASGKSTVAKTLAVRLGFHYLDTGAMYRAIAWRALQTGTDVNDEAALAVIAATEKISFAHDKGSALPTRVFVDEQDVTTAIRTPAVDDAVSPVSSLPLVREAMVAQQREIGAANNIVVEGRDIGTVVFPNAEVKVFLTASTHERARRRTVDMTDRGHNMSHESVKEALERRDVFDSTREASPLVPAADAVLLDTTPLSIDEVVETIAKLAESAA
jgi:cytidylate kinase